MKIENTINRIDPEFNKELEDIRKELEAVGIGKKHTSIRAITNILIKYKKWPQIKKDIYEYILNENGK